MVACSKAGDPQQMAGLQFVQHAGQAVMRQDDKGGLHLILSEVSPYTAYFPNRPERIAGLWRNEWFFQVFQGVGSVPPNAALAASSSARDVIALELLSQHYDADKRVIEYGIRPLGRYHTGDGKAGPRDISPLPMKLMGVSLFIDGIAAPFDGITGGTMTSNGVNN